MSVLMSNLCLCYTLLFRKRKLSAMWSHLNQLSCATNMQEEVNNGACISQHRDGVRAQTERKYNMWLASNMLHTSFTSLHLLNAQLNWFRWLHIAFSLRQYAEIWHQHRHLCAKRCVFSLLSAIWRCTFSLEKKIPHRCMSTLIYQCSFVSSFSRRALLWPPLGRQSFVLDWLITHNKFVSIRR